MHRCSRYYLYILVRNFLNRMLLINCKILYKVVPSSMVSSLNICSKMLGLRDTGCQRIDSNNEKNLICIFKVNSAYFQIYLKLQQIIQFFTPQFLILKYKWLFKVPSKLKYRKRSPIAVMIDIRRLRIFSGCPYFY